MKREENERKRDRQYFAAKKLYGERASEFLKGFRRKKRLLALTVVTLSFVAAFCVLIREGREPELIGDRYIERNGKDGSVKNVLLEAQSSNGYSKRLQVSVKEQRYTEEELKELLPAFLETLRSTIFSADDSADYVSRDLHLVSSLPGYPFRLTGRADQPLLLSNDGKINEERLDETGLKEKGVVVNLTATAEYQDFSEETQIPVRIFGKHLTKEEVFWQQVDESIAELSEKSAFASYQQLPSSVGEEEMTYREHKGREWILLIVCGVFAAILLIRHMDEDLQKQVKKRDEQLECEYPQIVNRFVLYYGAGLTIKNIWQRICRDYEERKKITGKNCAYEEMLKADRRMQDGVGESEAYTGFSSAISLPRYRNLIGLLQQTLQTGGGDIKEQLNAQLTEAFSEQKRNARILGEKAGTRMLLPMFLMLMIVLVIILIPAFLSF